MFSSFYLHYSHHSHWMARNGSLLQSWRFHQPRLWFPIRVEGSRCELPSSLLQANGTSYDWFAFAGDLLFFIAIAYLIILYVCRKSQAVRTITESRKLLGLLTLVVIALAAGNYAYDSVYGTGNHWTGYGN